MHNVLPTSLCPPALFVVRRLATAISRKCATVHTQHARQTVYVTPANCAVRLSARATSKSTVTVSIESVRRTMW